MAKTRAPHGAPNKYIIEVAAKYQGDGCLTWPFGKTGGGYGALYIGIDRYAHRAVCRLVHGDPADPRMYATHSCGNGHLGCVNPKHLRWATPTENCADKLLHGTHSRGERQSNNKLSTEHVIEIRRLRGHLSQSQLGDRFGVSPKTINDIHQRKIWRWLEDITDGQHQEEAI